MMVFAHWNKIENKRLKFVTSDDSKVVARIEGSSKGMKMIN